MFKIYNEICIWGDDVDDKTITQMDMCQEHSCKAALMGDNHLGYSQPIGGVVAYDGLISVSGCGYDIACGNMAVRVGTKAYYAKTNIKKIMDQIFRDISFGMGKPNPDKPDNDIFSDPLWKEKPLRSLKDVARNQLGTIGSGNHYIDIFIDENEDVWVGVHFGSRKLGHSIATHFLKAAGAKDGIMAYPCLLKENSDLGEQYINCMNLAGKYAYAGREWVCDKVASIMGTEIFESVHNHHNFAWKEKQHGGIYDGKDLWVIRKGATPLHPGQRSFIGGSMGDISVICEGTDTMESRLSMHSAPHGAGRVMGRMEAKGKKKVCKDPNSPDFGKTIVKKEGRISQEMMDKWIKEKGVYLRGGGVDESPHAYRRLPEVLKHHEDYLKIIHTLTPIGVAMA